MLTSLQNAKQLVFWAPSTTPPLPNFHCPGLGLVPKHDGGWHAITYLFHTAPVSIIQLTGLYTIYYCSVDDAFAIVSSLGRGALMAKINLRNVFHLTPVRQQD